MPSNDPKTVSIQNKFYIHVALKKKDSLTIEGFGLGEKKCEQIIVRVDTRKVDRKETCTIGARHR